MDILLEEEAHPGAVARISLLRWHCDRRNGQVAELAREFARDCSPSPSGPGNGRWAAN